MNHFEQIIWVEALHPSYGLMGISSPRLGRCVHQVYHINMYIVPMEHGLHKNPFLNINGNMTIKVFQRIRQLFDHCPSFQIL